MATRFISPAYIAQGDDLVDQPDPRGGLDAYRYYLSAGLRSDGRGLR